MGAPIPSKKAAGLSIMKGTFGTSAATPTIAARRIASARPLRFQIPTI